MADNRKYYYLKLKESFFEDAKVISLQHVTERDENGKEFPVGYLYCDILLKMYLMSLQTEGKLLIEDSVPYSAELIASMCRHDVETVRKALEQFKRFKLIEVIENGAIYMTDIQNYVGKSSTEADRVRKYRSRIKEDGNCVISKPKSEEIQIEEPEPEKKAKEYPKDFEEFWKTYPRHADKGQAYMKYKARIKDGFSPEELLTAARNYAEKCRRDRTEDKYIKHGKTFLGENTPFMDYLPKEPIQSQPADSGANPFKGGGLNGFS